MVYRQYGSAKKHKNSLNKILTKNGTFFDNILHSKAFDDACFKALYATIF